ncbi:FAD-dependent monooxygenase [Streptomyces sp. NPDC048248]|uniref:FAD-dependent monooxygenase n=1 Tax=Streptomyces sp. NPDC048248 TaxID=3365523 RepID=UPI0037237DF3
MPHTPETRRDGGQHAASGNPHAPDAKVIIVGAGPAGLLSACELLRRGISVRLIDRAAQPSPYSKALLVWPRTRDLFEDLGLVEDVELAGPQINAFSYFTGQQPLATYTFLTDAQGCMGPFSVPQYEIERILSDCLHRLGGHIEREVRLLGFDGLDFSGDITATDGVTTILEHKDGRIERARAAFVIGADGAGSTVRGQMGVGFVGSTFETAFGLVDAPIEGSLPSDQVLYFQSPSGGLAVVPMPKGVFRFFTSLPTNTAGFDLATMQRIVDERGPRGVRLLEPVWQSTFRVHGRRATEFQLGRVFLVGDAAHVNSPAGGQGMNTGLHDAHNLAWKLAAVLNGETRPDLLHSYDEERVAAAARVVRDTEIQTRAWMVKHPAQITARNAAFRLMERTGTAAKYYAPVMAGRRLAYQPLRETQHPADRTTTCRLRSRLPGRTTVGGVFPRQLARDLGITGPDIDPAAWHLAVTRGFRARHARSLTELIAGRRLRLVDLPGTRQTSHLTGCADNGYHLIRPDGHVAAHGHTADLSRLRAELDAGLPHPLTGTV